MNDNLKTSKNGLEFITKWEGCVLKPYKDVAGLRTVGVGHLIGANENFPDGVSITMERALELLSKDVEKCEVSIKKNFTSSLNQNQFDALVSFGFNCGVGVYSNSGVANAVKTGEFDKVPARLLEWNKARVNGVLQEVKGLTSRRKSEGDLFMKPADGTIISNFPVPWTKDSLADVQTKLQKLGLYSLRVDGIWGPGSNRAVTEFANRNGISLIDPSKGVSQQFLTELALKAG